MRGLLLITLVALATRYSNAVPTCPPEIADGGLLENPADCHTYYECVNGSPILMKCPPGLEWAEQYKRCDFPNVAQCKETETEAPTTVGVTTTVGPTTPRPTKCPAEDDPNHDVLLPNPEDCGTFFKCLGGVPYLIPCPTGQQWSIELNRCDLPEIAQCHETGTKTTAVPTTPGPSTPRPTQCPAEDDPNNDVLLPNLEDCGSFFKCLGGKPHLILCPPGQEWSIELNRCDLPEIAQCQKVALKQIFLSYQVRKDDRCPDEEGEENVFLPNPEDCGSFYECSNGELVLQPCPTGLHWNDKTKLCDYPLAAGCEEVKNIVKPNLFALNTILEPLQVRKDDRCPDEEGEENVFLPNPEDCGSFYECSNGELVLQQCPTGLHWNDKTKLCDYPLAAGCEEVKNIAKPNIFTLQVRKDDRCPDEDGEEDVLLPNPEDCTTFYKCNNGELVIQECPADLHWNDEGKYCDYPLSAGCEEVKNIAMPNIFTPQVRKDDRCPDKDGETGVFIPNPEDCTTFYQCSNGELVIQICPEGLHWNDRTKLCDYPLSAGCQKVNNFAKSNIFALKTILEILQTRKDDRCPDEDGEEDVLLPNPEDCTTFYKCNNGELVIQECPADLHWNDEGKYCDYPSNAGCQNAMNFAKSEWPTECPAENGEYDYFLPNLDDCSTYFKCDYGRKFLMECPVGTLWHAPMQRCDHAANAECASK